MRKVLLLLGALLLLPGILLCCFDSAALDEAYQLRLHRQLNTKAAAGLSQEDLDKAHAMLLAYLRDERDDLEMVADVFGYPARVFGDDEISHMEDVRALFRLERRVRGVCLIGGCVLLAAGFVCTAMRRRGASAYEPRGTEARVGTSAASGWRAASRELRRAGCIATLCWLLTLGAIALYMSVDFQSAFLLFHKIAFRNGLWMMDPNTQLMIRMLPQDFFSSVVRACALRMAAGLLLFPVVCALPTAFAGKRR